jgi:hypothetical protein
LLRAYDDEITVRISCEGKSSTARKRRSTEESWPLIDSVSTAFRLFPLIEEHDLQIVLWYYSLTFNPRCELFSDNLVFDS